MNRGATRIGLLVLAGIGAVFVVRQLYVGTPLPGTRSLLVYPAVAIAALALAGAEWLGRRRASLVAACLALALFVSNARRIGSGDTVPATLLPYALVRHGTLALDLVLPVHESRPYWVSPGGGRLWSEYPVASGLLALPVYLPAVLGPHEPAAIAEAEKLSAALIAAVSVGFVLAILLALGAPLPFAALATLLYAAGSPVLSTSAQALWQHGPSALALSGMIWALLRARADRRFDGIAGLFAGVAVATRPTDVLIVAALWLALLVERRPAALRFALAAAGPAMLVAAYQTVAFGAPWRTGYDYAAPRFGAEQHLFELLLSPTRGLLLYVPWVLLSAIGIIMGLRRDRLYGAMGAGIAATIGLYAFWPMWWGGWCYGPRLLADLMPLFAAGLAPLAASPRRWMPWLAVTGALAVLLHGSFVFNSRSERSRRLFAVDDEEAAMDWSRHPIPALFPGRNARSSGEG